MAEAVVNTTSPTTTTPAPAPAGKPAPKFDNALDRVVYDLNVKYGGADDPMFKTIGEITDEVQAKAPENAHKHPPQKRQNVPANGGQESQPLQQQDGSNVSGVKRYKVGNKVVELTPEEQDRQVQKGLYLEGKNAEIAKQQREVQAAIGQLQAQQQQFQNMMQAFAQNPAAVYEQMYGPEAARQKFEPYVGQHIMREVEYEKNPTQRAIDEANRRAQIAEARAQQLQQQFEQTKVQTHSQSLAQEFQNIIIQALEKTGNPWMKNDMTSAAMAMWMQRGLERNIQYNPEQLVELVLEDFQTVTRATTHPVAVAIIQAKKMNDANAVVKFGQQLANFLGDEVVYALGQFHLARIRGAQPNLPPPVMETQRRIEPEKPKNQYMKWEDYEAERKRRVAAMERGENVPDW